MLDNIENQKVWSTKQIVFILFFAISSTFTLTLIYSEFLLHGKALDTLNRRLDTKTERNAEAIDKLKEDVKHLQLPNTDK